MKKAVALHKKLKGKISITPKIPVTKKLLSSLYTPGVGEIVKLVGKNKKSAYTYTGKGNSVAIVTDGSSILGLGNRGPEAALPVMEGKAILFKTFANIDAYPICVKTQDVDEIVSLVNNISPGFGGINLEDISAPRCFEIEERLQDIGIPVMHDDQHGTAMVVLGGLINASKVVKKDFEDLNIAIVGAGAAGTAIAKLLSCVGYHKNICTSVKNILICDSKGIISKKRKGLSPYKQHLARLTNTKNRDGSMEDALEGADVFIGLSSRGGLLKPSMVNTMENNPIIFALSNPYPEIMPSDARRAGARVVATGRSDFPNQVNNLLAFPGIFRGALDGGANKITNVMKLVGSYAIAHTIKKPHAGHILPSAFDKHVVKNVAAAVKKSC
jgi:malate dehydrogenase (oxaloacetate-decarboxylating)